MKVFLVRHGDADADIPDGLSDEARTLVTKARPLVLAHFQALKPRLEKVELVLTSPLARTVQTATLLGQALGHEGAIRAHRALLPDMPVGALDSLLRDGPGDPVVLVGHQPSMGSFASHLLGLPSFPKPFAPATVVGLDVSFPPSGEGPLSAQLLFYAPMGQPVLQSLT